MSLMISTLPHAGGCSAYCLDTPRRFSVLAFNVYQAGPDAMQTAEDRRKAKAEEEEATVAAGAGTAEAAAAAAAATGGESRGSERRLAIRTRFCDDFFEDCAGRRGIKQVLLTGGRCVLYHLLHAHEIDALWTCDGHPHFAPAKPQKYEDQRLFVRCTTLVG